MNALLVLFWASFLCLIISLITLTFPTIYPRKYIKNGSKKIQIISLIIYIIICIIAIALYGFLKIKITFWEIKVAIMVIPVVACILFSVFLYYPLTRFLVRTNIEDQSTMDTLLTQLFKCSFSDKDGSKNALNTLKAFIHDNKEVVTQYGLLVYLSEYINQSQYSINSKPDENIIRCVLDRCNQVKHDIDNYSPEPFPNIGLILSFVFSTILTVLLSIITVIPQ